MQGHDADLTKYAHLKGGITSGQRANLSSLTIKRTPVLKNLPSCTQQLGLAKTADSFDVRARLAFKSISLQFLRQNFWKPS